MRFLARVHVIAVLVLASLFYFVWIYPSLHVTSRITKAWTGSSRRIVVFGDSFSDTAVYVVDPPDEGSKLVRDPAEGYRWTEVLCQEFVCDSVDNFARSSNSRISPYSGGAVVDNAVYANTTSRNETSLGLLPDLKAQIEQWVSHEEKKGKIVDDGSLEETVFTISFGFWDIWQYATLEVKAAQDAISCSIYEMFQQLDIIADRSLTAPRIVIPTLWDITFSPRYMSLSQNQTGLHFGEEQHKMIYLVKYWNSALAQMAVRWPGGDVFLPDWHTWTLEQIRSTQMDQLGIHDSMGIGTQRPVFRNVSAPCYLPPVVDEVSAKVGAGKQDHCQNPRHYLFWDDMHFSGSAHQLLGKEVAKMISANDTANASIRSSPSATEGNNGNQLVKIHLIPSLAPGN